ncbi:MAG: GspE/PulE family protein [Phycisphaeraceae bacterium]
MPSKRQKLGEILLEWGVLDKQELKDALEVAEGSRKKIGEVLIEMEVADQDSVAKALAKQHNMEFVDLSDPKAVSRKNLQLLPDDIIQKYLVLPLGKDGDRLKLLVHDPLDLALIDDLQFRLGGRIDLALGAKGRIKEYIDHVMGTSQASIDELTQDLSVDHSIDRGGTMDVEAREGEGDSEENDANSAPVVRLVNKIIAEAVRTGTSDIHVEPFEDRVRLRYRIDGVCQVRDTIPKGTQQSVIARLKIMAGMRVEERRIPQDGRIKMKIDGKVTDFRVSACPAYHGESVVLRILRPDAAMVGLKNLGMRQDTLDKFNDIIRRPNGIFLVTGPTGSGKTTTLYSALGVLNRPDIKIITAEDPIEYNFKGINQCQVNETIGLKFSTILRAMLRQAPNIILVGEIRDKEVGEVAVQAALTGHLVFSTLHTNDAPSAITRLIDMGVKPFLVASSIQAVLAQRLVRLLCKRCKQPDDEPNRRTMQLVGITDTDLEHHTIYKAVGCPKCNHTGFKGRQGVYELMEMTGEIRDHAFQRSPVGDIRKAAAAQGMRNLLGDGKLKILDGLTTMDEVAKIAQSEGLLDYSDTEEEVQQALAT